MKQNPIIRTMAIMFIASFVSCTPDPIIIPEPPVNVTFQGATQTGGVSFTTDTTSLELSFDIDPATLTLNDITISGATKGELSPIGSTRTLSITNLTVADGESVSVTVNSPRGYIISESTREVSVYRLIAIGRAYPGGRIGYVLQPSDQGYDANTPHGLIVAPENTISYESCWSRYTDSAIGSTGTAIGTGRANTDLILAQNGAWNYAAYYVQNYRGGGFTDWYLPSRDELVAIMHNKTAVGLDVPAYCVCFWSSSERDASHAYSVWYDFYSSAEGEGKYGSRYIRAVRDF